MRRFIAVALIGLGVVGIYLSYPQLSARWDTFVKSTDDLTADVAKPITPVEEEVTPGLVTESENHAGGVLVPADVIARTNQERKNNNLPPLTANAKLTAAAQAKVKDMFDKQYFEHISPDGSGPSVVIEKTGYRYIVVGENLALGNFKDSAALVQAWMDSPGHKANILHTRFSEIGVAVAEGIYNGQKTWLAVQEFGLPASSCPIVDGTLKSRINADTIRADTISAELIELQQKLRTMPRATPEEETAYRSSVEYYNALVARYNKLVSEIKQDIEEYNEEVRVYNRCVEA